MKQKRKHHELSDDDDTKSPLLAANTPNKHKRAKLSLSSHDEQICDTEDEEVWIVRLPRHLNPDQLHNQAMKQKKESGTLKRSKLMFSSGGNGEKCYETNVTKWKEGSNSLTLLRQHTNGQFKLENVDCKGEINFHEEVKVPEVDTVEVPTKYFVQQPKDLQWRHPFFGLATPDVQIGNQNHIDNEFKESKSKKSKKKNKDKDTVDAVELRNGDLKVVKVDPDSGVSKLKKKKKKLKHEDP